MPNIELGRSEPSPVCEGRSPDCVEQEFNFKLTSLYEEGTGSPVINTSNPLIQSTEQRYHLKIEGFFTMEEITAIMSGREHLQINLQ